MDEIRLAIFLILGVAATPFIISIALMIMDIRIGKNSKPSTYDESTDDISKCTKLRNRWKFDKDE